MNKKFKAKVKGTFSGTAIVVLDSQGNVESVEDVEDINEIDDCEIIEKIYQIGG